jgi:hypothetical protein
MVIGGKCFAPNPGQILTRLRLNSTTSQFHAKRRPAWPARRKGLDETLIRLGSIFPTPQSRQDQPHDGGANQQCDRPQGQRQRLANVIRQSPGQ